jgi:exosortase
MIKLAQYQVCLFLLWAVSLLVGWRSLVDTFALSLRDDQYTYILLILPISASMIFLERRSLRTMDSIDVRAASAVMVIAILVACFARVWSARLTSDALLSIRMLALVIWWDGTLVLCFGTRALRSVLFPLLFLFGLVPLPQVALNVIVALLQHWSTWTAHLFFAACGIPVAQDGVLLTIPGLTIRVAQECSSIRSSSMLFVTTIVLAHILLRSPWRKALVISLAVPLSVAKNGLRIFTIAMLATRVDSGYMTGRLHHNGGIVFFAAALIGVFTLLWIFRRGEDLPLKPKLNLAKATANEN